VAAVTATSEATSSAASAPLAIRAAESAARSAGRGGRWGAPLDAVVRGYASILFSRSRLVGLLLLVATATVPRVFAFGLAAVVLANLVAGALRLDPRALGEGQFGYNALLIGLGVGATFDGLSPALGVLVLAVIATVLLTAAFRASLGASGLPALSLPFLAIWYLLLGASALTHLPYAPYAIDPWHDQTLLPEPIALAIRSLGALFFLPRLDAGALVLLAVLVHSRIAAILAAIAFGAVFLLDGYVLSVPSGSLIHVLGYNAMLVAVALGGVWFVPSPSALGLALLGVLLSVMVTIGSAPPLARMGVPAMILPFNVTAILMLYAMRQRTRDGAPKAVFSSAESPESIVEEDRSRAARFFARYPVRFRLPFRGAWICTQGNDGAHTHQGEWRHGLDFEVRGRDGALFSGSGADVRDFHAYGLPVVAAADGVVAKVIDGVPDNAIGRMDLQHNWGNVVVLWHATGLYSVVAHLKSGSLKVREGDSVRAGQQLATCGSSGRSPQPHLHFQLQATAVLGAPTLPVHFHHVVREDGEAREVARELCPADGDVVRAIDPDPGLAELIAIPPGTEWTFEHDGGRRERLRADVGLLGDLHLRATPERPSIVDALARPAALAFEAGDAMHVALDAGGLRRSVIHLLFAALPRMPFDAAAPAWSDELPRRRFTGALGQLLGDLLALFTSSPGIEMRYALRREGTRVIVTGISMERAPGQAGAPLVTTSLELERGVGPTRVELTHRGVTRRATRVLAASSSTSSSIGGNPS
jgi:urea transporter